jgi:GNAT superfamily N-acetyltransferase
MLTSDPPDPDERSPMVIHPVCTDPRVRQLVPEDVPTTVALVQQLAGYERLADQCHMSEDQLRTALFGPDPALYGLAALSDTTPAARQVGYALYFLNFSTFEGVHGIYLEDLYVEPDHRGTGLGKQVLRTLAATAVANGFARVEWWVLKWNTPSIDFYNSLGAVPMDEWTPFRLTGPALRRTAAGTG